MNRETRRHRALADRTRRCLLELLRAAAEPLSADELSRELELHPNTVRAHLQVLEDAELVDSSRPRQGRAGRPRRLFTAVPDDAGQEHALLAAALASSLEPLPDGAEIARVAGTSWGRVLVERLEPGRPSDEGTCVERVARLLRSRGFSPTTTGRTLVMHRCPFRELAERYPAVVCSFHAGLIDGALQELDAPVRLLELEPWRTPRTCVACLGPPAR